MPLILQGKYIYGLTMKIPTLKLMDVSLCLTAVITAGTFGTNQDRSDKLSIQISNDCSRYKRGYNGFNLWRPKQLAKQDSKLIELDFTTTFRSIENDAASRLP